MKSMPLTASSRTQTRRRAARNLRASGRIPANIYGRAVPPQNLELDAKAFDQLVHQAHSEIILVDLEVAGDARPQRLALVQDVQHHPLSGKVLHVDLHEVKPDEKVVIQVPVESFGEAVGVKVGAGTLEHVLFKVKVRALPRDLPEEIRVDVSALEVGKSIHIGEIPAPEGVELLGDAKIPVFTCAAPLVAEAAPAEGAAPGTQPEMIKEKKVEAKGGKK